MNILPSTLYRAADVRELDRLAIEEFNIPGDALMERAGAAAFELLCLRWPQAQRIAVLCGVGNNGGDGFVVARLAQAAGMSVQPYQVGDANKIRGAALATRQRMTKAGLPCLFFSAHDLGAFDVVVDALLGTGLHGEVGGEWRIAIEAINKSAQPVLALDIPSGLQADTGRILGTAVRAQATLTFVGLKQGLFTGAGPDHCGTLVFHSLDIPAEAYKRVPSTGRRLNEALLQRQLPLRPRTAHKGEFGHVLAIGGDHGYTGAVRLMGEAALRAGAGLVSIATRTDHAAFINLGRPELMSHGVRSAAQLRTLLSKATVVALGPGLGQSAWARVLFGAALQTKLPLVVDADALTLLAQEPTRRDAWILTPHPGEAARLLRTSAQEIQNDRFTAVRELQHKYGGVVVLKGAGTLIYASDGSMSLCSAGNPGMASGGMGDVLTGIIAAFLAQGMNLNDAACTGVYVHAHAADATAQAGERGILASDLFARMRSLINDPPPNLEIRNTFIG